MQIKSFLFILALAECFAVRFPATAAGVARPAGPDNLLFRVQFIGTAALATDTNAAYLTNFAALPETATLGTQIVSRASILPARLVNNRKGTLTNETPQSMDADGAQLLQPVFMEMMQEGFTLELFGDTQGVTAMALAAKSSPATARRWNTSFAGAAKVWFPSAESKSLSGESWTAGDGTVRLQKRGDWTLFALSKSNATIPISAIEKTVTSSRLDTGSLLQAELASGIVPRPIQRSVYGGFSRFKFSLSALDQNLKIRGTATYTNDLPGLSANLTIPTNLVTETPISFTVVREPGAWLEPNSALRRILPRPVPHEMFFLGGASSPIQLSVITPFVGHDKFNSDFGPSLTNQLQPLANLAGSGSIVLDTNRAAVQWQGVPFVSPQVMARQSGTNDYLVAESFPAIDSPPGLTPALIEQISNRSNLVLYDWEFTQLRFDSWIHLGQLALLFSNSKQLDAASASLKWLRAAQKVLSNGGNTSTEITQTGPRELSLNRSAPLAFTSIELFWLANWLESSNFPAANFLMPLPPEPDTAPEPPKNP